MKNNKIFVIAVALIAIVVAVAALLVKRTPVASTQVTQSSTVALGTISGKDVLKSELDSGEKIKLYEAENAYYKALEDVMTQRYLTNFFEKHRKDKNLPDVMAAQNEFFKDKVNVTDAEVQRLIAENKDNPNLQKLSESERNAQVKQYLEGNAKRAAIQQFVEEAKRRNEIKVALEKPIEPRLEVSDANNPSLGAKDAKVTIVEFADFQCPFCARMVPTLKELVKKYEGKVRWVYRDFPLTEIHPEAIPAAAAASCAGQQGKYFEMHHKLFDNYKDLGNSLYTKTAKELGLDEAAFETCRKDPKVVEEIMRDQADGAKLGVNGTPTYFVNGRKMGGADVNEFSRIIDEELSKI